MLCGSFGLRLQLSVTKYGALFTWGSGENGQLGHGDTADELAPRRVDALYFQGDWVVAVAAGSAQPQQGPTC